MRRIQTAYHGVHRKNRQRDWQAEQFSIPRGGLRNQVFGKLSDNDGDFGWLTVNAITDATVPAAVTDLAATPVNADVLLNFSAPDSGGSAVTDYVIEYADVGGVPGLFDRPTAQNSGVYNFDILTDFVEAGTNTTITTETVYEDKRFTKRIIAQAKVTLINCLIDADALYAIQANHANAELILINCTVTKGNSSLILMRKGRIAGCHLYNSGGDGIKVDENTDQIIVEHTFIEKLGNETYAQDPNDVHADGIQAEKFGVGGGLLVRGCNIFMPRPGEAGYPGGVAGDGEDYHSNACVFMKTTLGAIQNVVCDSNWFTGGNYSVYFEDAGNGHGAPSSWQLLSNKFNNPQFGYITNDGGAIAIQGNTDELSGANIDTELGGPVTGASPAPPTFVVFDDGISNGTSVFVTGLTPAHLYQFRIKAVNDIGESTYSNIAEATTGGGTVSTPMVGFLSPSTTISEANQTQSITITLSTPSVSEIRVPFTLTGNLQVNTDYTVSPASELVFPPGALSRNIVVTTIDDTLTEGQEVATITLQPPANGEYELEVGGTSHVVTVTDDDNLPFVYFETIAQDANEDGGTVQIVLRTTEVLAEDLNVNIQFGGTASNDDYSVPTQFPVLMQAGSDAGLVNIQITDDTLFEDSETIELQIQTDAAYSIGTNDTHTITILDDEQNVVRFETSASNINEDGGTRIVRLKISEPAVETEFVTVVMSGTAILDTDYTIAPTLVRFNPGEDTAQVVITPINNAIVDTGRQLVLSLGTPISDGIVSSGINNTHVVTFIDDEGDTGDGDIAAGVDMQTTFNTANNASPLAKVNIPLPDGITAVPDLYLGAPGSEAKAQVNVVAYQDDGIGIRIVQAIGPTNGASTLSVTSTGSATQLNADNHYIPADMADIEFELDAANIGLMRCKPFDGVAKTIQDGPFYRVVRYANHFTAVNDANVHAFTGYLYAKYRTDTDVVELDVRFVNARFNVNANPYKPHPENDGKLIFDSLKFSTLPANHTLEANVERPNMDTANGVISDELGATESQKMGPRGGFVRRYCLYAAGHSAEARQILDGKHNGSANTGDCFHARGYGAFNAANPDWTKPGSTITAPGALTNYAAAKQRVDDYYGRMKTMMESGTHAADTTANQYATEEGWWHGHGFDYAGAAGGNMIWNTSGWWQCPKVGTMALLYADAGYERTWIDLVDPTTFEQVTYFDILEGSTGTWPNYNDTGTFVVPANKFPWAVTSDQLSRRKVPQFLENGVDGAVPQMLLLNTTKPWSALESGKTLPFGRYQDSFLEDGSIYGTPKDTHCVRTLWAIQEAIFMDNDAVCRDLLDMWAQHFMLANPQHETVYRENAGLRYTSMITATNEMNDNDGGIGGGLYRAHGHIWMVLGMWHALKDSTVKVQYVDYVNAIRDMYNKTVCPSGAVARLDRHSAAGEVGSNYDYSEPNVFDTNLPVTNQGNNTGRHLTSFTSFGMFHTCFVHAGLWALVQNTHLSPNEFGNCGQTLANSLESTYAGTDMVGWPYFPAVTIGTNGKGDTPGAALPYWHLDPTYTSLYAGLYPFPISLDRHVIQMIGWCYLKDRDPQYLQMLKRVRGLASSSTLAELRDNIVSYFNSGEVNNLALTSHMIAELQKVA